MDNNFEIHPMLKSCLSNLYLEIFSNLFCWEQQKVKLQKIVQWSRSCNSGPRGSKITPTGTKLESEVIGVNINYLADVATHDFIHHPGVK